LAGDPYKGNPKSKLVVIEFSDFQCPACQRHALDVQPALDRAFVESGEIMWVFKHLPFRIHPQAPVAAAAAECAGDQARFWEMHHLLFESMDQWSTGDDPDSMLLSLAESLDLSMDAFAACFNSRQAMERVLSDLYDAQGVVQTTPAFIMVYGGSGGILKGSRPVDQFVPILQNALDEAKASE
jgi:protein-disulfide isomerase